MNGFKKTRRWGDGVRAAIAGFAIVAVGAFVASAPMPAHAVAPNAGAPISNVATATYQDAGGTSRSTTSNAVTTTVSQVKSFTVNSSGARSASQGQTVYYPHFITNTGNGTDTYTLNPAVASIGGPPNFTHTGLAYYPDSDGNGVPDNFIAINTSGPIARNGIFRFVVAGTVPLGANLNDTGTITVSVSDTRPVTDTTNVDTTTVSACALNVTKAMSSVSGPSPAGPITVTLSYNNLGTAACNAVEIRDVMPSGFTYNQTPPNRARWSVSGATALDDATGLNDPAGIDYSFAGGQVTAIITSIAAGTNGNLTFELNVNAGLAPTTGANQAVTTNVASFRIGAGPFANTNPVLYTVLQTAGVVANDDPNQPGDTVVNDIVEVPSAAPGSTFFFNNRIRNSGNGVDSFDITLAGQAAWPAGTTFALLQSDAVTPLLDTNGNAAPDTGPVAAGAQVTVVVRVTLPAVAPSAVYDLVKTATSRFNSAVSDTVTDRLLAVVANNTVDLTNNSARTDSSPPGLADNTNIPTYGWGPTGTTVITTNTISVSDTAPTITRFALFVNNTGSVNGSFNLGVSGVPAGWTVVFRANASGVCATTAGPPLTSIGPINAGNNSLVCAEVTVPVTTTGQATPGAHDLDFTVTSAINATVTDVKRDRVFINDFHRVTLTPNNTQQTFPGGIVTYSHTMTNTGNVPETVSFAASCLTNSISAQPWTSQAYLDTNNNGILEVGTDPQIVCGSPPTDTLNVNQSRTVFVRVNAPASALSTPPWNVTTLTATYFGPATVSATDTTTITDGLTLNKEQRTINCDGTAPGAYTTAAIPSGAATAPGQCIGYRVTATNAAGSPLTSIVINDSVPVSTTMHYPCGAPATTVGVIAGTTPATGLGGIVTANVGTLNSLATAVLTFCVRIDF